VIVATPDLASLRNAKNIIELVKQSRPNDTPPRLVLNQVGQPKRPEIPVKDFAETMGFEVSAVLPFDPLLFGTAANNGQMLMEVGPKSPASDGVRRLSEMVTGRTAQDNQKAPIPFLSFLKGKKRA
jgi:pilus assembly protein CpaE